MTPSENCLDTEMTRDAMGDGEPPVHPWEYDRTGDDVDSISQYMPLTESTMPRGIPSDSDDDEPEPTEYPFTTLITTVDGQNPIQSNDSGFPRVSASSEQEAVLRNAARGEEGGGSDEAHGTGELSQSQESEAGLGGLSSGRSEPVVSNGITERPRGADCAASTGEPAGSVAPAGININGVEYHGLPPAFAAWLARQGGGKETEKLTFLGDEEEEEEDRVFRERELAARQALDESERLRSEPLKEEQRTAVMNAMRGVTLGGGGVPEWVEGDQLVKRVRDLTSKLRDS